MTDHPTNTILGRTVFGNKRIHFGRSVFSGTATGGTINTGLKKVESFHALSTGGTAAALILPIGQSFPHLSGTSDEGMEVTSVDIDSTKGESGSTSATFYWEAKGL